MNNDFGNLRAVDPTANETAERVEDLAGEDTSTNPPNDSDDSSCSPSDLDADRAQDDVGLNGDDDGGISDAESDSTASEVEIDLSTLPPLPPYVSPSQYVNMGVACAYGVRMFGENRPPFIVEVVAGVEMLMDAIRAHGEATAHEAAPAPPALDAAAILPRTFDEYMSHSHQLFLIALHNLQMGNSGPHEIFSALWTFLWCCFKRKTLVQARDEHLQRFQREPYATALSKIRRTVMQALPGYENEPPERTPVDFVQVGDPDQLEGENIRINLPSSPASFESGNGEGTWGIVHPAVKARSDAHEEAGNRVFVGILDNQPRYSSARLGRSHVCVYVCVCAIYPHMPNVC